MKGEDLALLETILDLLYDSKKADDFLLEVFKRSTFKGTMSESKYTYQLGQALYVKRSFVAHGTVKVGKLLYQVDVTVSDDGVKIEFGDRTIDYYPRWDKFYKIYDELKKGNAVLLTPEDFKDFKPGSDHIALDCENGMKILREIFRKVKVGCEPAKDDEKDKDKKDDNRKVDFTSNEDLFFDDEGSVTLDDFDY